MIDRLGAYNANILLDVTNFQKKRYVVEHIRPSGTHLRNDMNFVANSIKK